MSVFQILILIFIAILILALLFAYYLGVFMKITTQIKEIGPFKLMYFESQGTYYQSGQFYAQLTKIKIDHNLLDCDMVGFYFDSPDQIVDPNKCRFACCLVVNDVKSEVITECREKYQGLKYVELPKVKALAATPFPYKNILTFFISPMKVYPIFSEYCKNHQNKDLDYQSCVVEFYPRDNKNPKNFLSIDVCMPITKEGEQYVISSYPKPEYKKGIENTDSKKED